MSRRKKRGRPTTEREPMMTFRMPLAAGLGRGLHAHVGAMLGPATPAAPQAPGWAFPFVGLTPNDMAAQAQQQEESLGNPDRA
jgi:hypothetical protein